VSWIQQDLQHAYLPITIKKTPSVEFVAAQGGEVFATGLLDISSIIVPGKASCALNTSALVGDQMDDFNPPLVVTFVSNEPLLEVSALSKLHQESQSSVDAKLPFVAKIPMPAENRDVLQELRDEISGVIERIAQEYVAQYPTAAAAPVPADSNNNLTQGGIAGAEDKKTQFLQYLASNGIFHELQEKLRPAVLLAIQEKYGARGRALGKSAVMRSIDTKPISSETDNNDDEVGYERHIQSILSELYVFLLKECNIVLNSMFHKTVIQKQRNEVDNPARIDDEQESELQKLSRLLRQAKDAAADQRYSTAEELHMERLQLLEQSLPLYYNKQLVHDVYVDYTQYLLAQCSYAVALRGLDNESYQMLMKRARGALSVAYNQVSNQWSTVLLYAIMLIECDQAEEGEKMLHKVLALQLDQTSGKLYSMQSFDAEFSGYESDQLCPVHPRCYAVLAALFYLQGKQLMCRKALLLANRFTPLSSANTVLTCVCDVIGPTLRP
jgi:hypothetical protein